MSDWNRFLSALQSRAKSFESVKLASDRVGIIHALGFTDPLEVASIETEWNSRLPQQGQPQGSSSNLLLPTPVVTKVEGRTLMQLAFEPESLARVPEEMQDQFLANEVLDLLCGIGSSYFVRDEESLAFVPSEGIPIALRAALVPACDLATALISLQEAREVEWTGQSLVSMALGEAISDVIRGYLAQVKELRLTSASQRLPLIRILSRSTKIGYPILRLAKLLDDIRVNDELPSGAKLIHSLHAQHTRSSGNSDDEEIIHFVLRRTALPYLRILLRWMNDGVLDDPYSEFFVEEAAQYQDAASANGKLRWDRRFLIRKNEVPGFLQKDRLAGIALLAGKLRNLIHECGDDDAVPPIASDLEWGDAEELQRIVTKAHELTSRAVIHLLLRKYDLIGHLKCLRRYFLFGHGDWLVDFLDTADELLKKSPGQVKAHSVKVLLQSAVMKRVTGNEKSSHATCIGCSFNDMSFTQLAERLMGGDGRMSAAPPTRQSGVRVDSQKCIELLQLDYDVEWPVSLVVQPLFLQHLNLFFRLILWCRVCERHLTHNWFHQRVVTPALLQLRHQMLQFLRQFQFYAAHFVLEPLWEKMLQAVGQASTVADLDKATNEFWENARKSLLLSEISRHRFGFLTKILETINAFAHLQLPVGRREVDQVAISWHSQFLQSLRQLAAPQGADYAVIVPLLTLLDFNRFYENKKVYTVMHGVAAEAELAQHQTIDHRSDSVTPVA
jgi:gamma-tubulin complex component 2